MLLFFQFKQRMKIEVKTCVALPNETDTGVSKDNICHGRNKLIYARMNCVTVLRVILARTLFTLCGCHT